MPTVPPDRAEAPLVLAIDIGSSTVRTLVYDRLGRAVDGLHTRGDHQLHLTAEGAAELDMDRLLELVWQCIDEVLQGAGGLALPISGVASCSLVGNVLAVDEQFRPLTPVYTYADTRARSDAARLRGEYDPREVHQRTGCPFHAAYLPARLRWMARTRMDLFQRVFRWVSLGEYMEWQLFGQASVSYSVASWSGLLDRHRLDWDESLLAAIPLHRDRLSALSHTGGPRQGLREEYARRWPGLRHVPWFSTIADGAAANIGSGCLSGARVALTIGTTGAVRAVLDEPVRSIPRGLWCYRVDGRRSLPGGALSEGGNVASWLRRVLNLVCGNGGERALLSSYPDGHGLTVLPFFAGERSPGWADDARATLHGLSLTTTPQDIVRAVLEAVAYRVALVFEALEALLPSRAEVVASGGALLGSPAWLQIMADVLDRPVVVSQVAEASARGAALLALQGLGVLDSLEQAPSCLGAAFLPDPGRHAIYQEAIERHKGLYRKLIAQSG